MARSTAMTWEMPRLGSLHVLVPAPTNVGDSLVASSAATGRDGDVTISTCPPAR
jgi:hypothetical protein